MRQTCATGMVCDILTKIAQFVLIADGSSVAIGCGYPSTSSWTNSNTLAFETCYQNTKKVDYVLQCTYIDVGAGEMVSFFKNLYDGLTCWTV